MQSQGFTGGSTVDTGYDSRCAEDEVEFAKYNYTDLATNTKFSLVVEGFGYHSFRLTEALGSGSIPVILVDHYVLPYSSILDWDAFSIRIPEHRLAELPVILRAVPADEIDRKQREVVRVYEAFFSSLSQQVYTAMEEIRLNLFTHPDHRQEEVKTVQQLGLPYHVPALINTTAAQVLQDSMNCNSPPHRRTKVKDSAVMRR